MAGWSRNMLFSDTGLPWVPSSPHIPHITTSLFYPATGILGELYVVSIGVGYTMPFETFAAEWIDAEKLAAAMNLLSLPGLIFRPVHYKPYYSVLTGKEIHGVQIHITDPVKAPLTLVQFYLMQETHKLWPDKDLFAMCEKSRLDMFDKVCGTDQVRLKFVESFKVSSIENIWNSEVPAFRKKAEKYFLYK
jgi:uncharacterized protein YbbC (DUF1343 family)